MKTIKEKVLKRMDLVADKGAPHDEAIDLTLTEVGKLIDGEKKIVKLVCLGLAHPSETNQEEFTKYLQNTVNFHINQIKQKLGIK